MIHYLYDSIMSSSKKCIRTLNLGKVPNTSHLLIQPPSGQPKGEGRQGGGADSNVPKPTHPSSVYLVSVGLQ